MIGEILFGIFMGSILLIFIGSILCLFFQDTETFKAIDKKIARAIRGERDNNE